MPYSATYEYMYNVIREADGSFQLEPGAAAAHTVDFTANNADVSVGHEIHITSAGNGLNGAYDYAGSLTTAEGGTGYIVYDAADQQYYMLTDTKFNFAGSPDLALGHPDSTGGGSTMPVCYMAGTRIATPEGETKVEDLKAGDLVVTADGRQIAVRWIGRQTVAPLFAGEFALPVRIKAGALGENMPSRDLLVSHAHALFVDGVLVQAGALVNETSILRETNVPKTFVYYHVEVDDHSLILAENTPAETFVDNVERVRFDNWHEYEALYPAGKKVAEMPYPRAKAARQVPSALRTRIAERAGVVAAAKVQSAA